MTFEKGNSNWANETAKPLVPEVMQKLRATGAGRPHLYDKAKVQPEIVARLCCGESLQMICRDEAMPSLATIKVWMSDDSDFRQAVSEARQLGTEALQEACINIASGDDLSTGSIERDKLLCSVIKWIAEKRDPNNHRQIGSFSIVLQPGDDEYC